jgi:hypothetical protein
LIKLIEESMKSSRIILNSLASLAKMLRQNGILDATDKPFHHQDEKEGRKRVTFPNSSRRIKGGRGRAIYKKSKKDRMR